MIPFSFEFLLLLGALFGGLLALLRWPEAGILINLLLLYLNIPALGVKLYGVPSLVAASTGLLLVPAFLNNVLTKVPRVVLDVPFMVMILFLVSLLLSATQAVDQALSTLWIMNYVFEGVVLYFLIVNTVRSTATLRRIVIVLLVAGGGLGSLSIYQEVSQSYSNEFGGLAQRTLERETAETQAKDAMAPRVREKVRTAHRAQGPLDDPNIYAQILLLIVPLGWLGIRHERSMAMKLALLALTLSMLGAVLLTYSRGAFMAIVVALIVMVVLRCISLRHLAVGCAVFLAVAFAVAPGYTGRMLTLSALSAFSEDPAEVQADISARGRAAEMIAALNVFRDYPLIGVGPGQFSKVYSLTYMSENYKLKRITEPRRAHSLYLELAAETGAIGLGLFMMIVALVLWRLLQAVRAVRESDPALADQARALFIGIITYLASGVFLQLSFQRYFWLIVALAAATFHLAQQRQSAPQEVPSGA